MLKRISDRWFLGILMAVLVTVVMVILCTLPAEAGNFGRSIEHRDGFISFQHEVAMDSAVVWFSYPVDSSWYDTTKLLPDLTFSDDSTVVGSRIDLDSIGIHGVRIMYYEKGAADTSGVDFGTWLNDYSNWFLGMLGGYMPGSGSREVEGTNYDRLIILFAGDSTLETRFYHVGGPAGADPDSSRADEKGDW